MLDFLEEGHELLTAGDVFTPDPIETWPDSARLDDIANAITSIRAHLKHGPISVEIVMDAIAMRLLEIGEGSSSLSASAPRQSMRNNENSHQTTNSNRRSELPSSDVNKEAAKQPRTTQAHSVPSSVTDVTDVTDVTNVTNVTKPATRLDRIAEMSGQLVGLLALVATVVLGIIGFKVSGTISATQEELTKPSPIVGQITAGAVFDVGGNPDSPPQLQGTVLHMRVFNKGRTDVEIASVLNEGTNGLFYSAQSCGEVWNEVTSTGSVRHTLGQPFVVEAGRSVPIVLFVKGPSFHSQVTLQLADGRNVKAVAAAENLSDDTERAYSPAYQQIEEQCRVPGWDARNRQPS